MFARLGTIHPFVDDNSEEIFKNIFGDSYDGDNTMVATLRSLLYPKFGEDFKMVFSYYHRNIGSYLNAKHIAENYYDGRTNQIVFLGLYNEPMETVMNKLDDPEQGLLKICPDLTEPDLLKKYYYDKFRVHARVYVNAEKNFALMVFDDSIRNIRFFHNCVALLPRYLPGIYPPGSKTTEDEFNVFKSLTENSSEAYLGFIQKLAQQIDFRKLLIEKMISGFYKRIKSNQLTSVENELSNIDNDIQDLNEKFDRYVNQRAEIVIRYEGIKRQLEKASDDEELLRYFETHPNISLVNTRDSYINIIVKTYLESFDCEAYTTYVRDGSILDDYYIDDSNPYALMENRKLLMDNLFNEDPLLKVRMCAYYSLNINGNVSTCSDFHYPEDCKDYLPNPHIDRHACLGAYKPIINEQLRKGNTIAAIESCLASAMAVNIHETSATFRPMMNNIFVSNQKIIETKAGEMLTPVEALEWLKKEKNE